MAVKAIIIAFILIFIDAFADHGKTIKKIHTFFTFHKKTRQHREISYNIVLL